MRTPLVIFHRKAHDGMARTADSLVAVLPADVVAVKDYPFSNPGENHTRIEFSDGRSIEVLPPFEQVMAELWPGNAGCDLHPTPFSSCSACRSKLGMDG